MSLEEQNKEHIEALKSSGVKFLERAPQGWKPIKGASNPEGWEWYSNGKSRFGKNRKMGEEYDTALVRVKERDK